jgi:integrase
MAYKIENRNGRHSFRYIDADGKEKRKNCPKGISYQEAKAFQVQFLSDKEKSKANIKDDKNIDFILWADFCKEFLSYVKRFKKHPQSYAAHINTFTALTPVKYAGEITKKHFDAYIDERLKKITKSSINRELNTFRAMFTWAIKEKYKKSNAIIEHPLENITKYKTKLVVKDRILYPLEIQKLFCCLEQNILPDGQTSLNLTKQQQETALAILNLLLHLGLRLKEAIVLEWSKISFDNFTATIEPQKTSEKNPNPDILPLRDKLTTFLTHFRKKHLKEKYVVPHIEEYRRFSKTSLSNYSSFISNIFKTLNIKNATAHTCRHTFISRLTLCNIDSLDIMHYARIRNIEVLKVYRHVPEGYHIANINKLDY